MTMPKVLIESPPVTPAKFGILSAALVRDSTDPHEAGGVTWDQESCGPALTNLADCYTVSTNITFHLDDDTKHVNLGGGSFPSGAACSGADVTVDYGDGATTVTTVDDLTGDLAHTYAAAGTYTITITSDAPCHITSSTQVTINDPSEGGHDTPGTISYIPSSLLSATRAGWTETEPFSLYHLSTCKLVGLTHDERVSYAERGLRAGEGRGIEQFLAGVWSSDDITSELVVLGTGAAAHPIVALAQVEAYAFGHYGGTAVIYMSRDVASYLTTTCALEVKGDKLMTKLGSLVVAGSGGDGTGFPGFPPEEDSGDGSWMFASGTLLVTRGVIDSTQEVISDSDYEGLVPPTAAYTNDYLVLAQRNASVGWECFLAAHQVDPIDNTTVGGGVDGGTP